LFSPRPEAPLPIVVEGASKAALTRAATLGDGWHGIGLTAAQVRGIVETLRSNPLRPGFEISLRTKLRLDGEVDGAEPGAALFGSVESVVEGVRAYTAAGVDHLVIEPVADRLPDLLDQLSAFAREVLPVVVQGARS
jgi:alkanesulfonate monooxygenase SsuD/methylene tetrahydromethanopterin reductase-like flavin-dependent oxidoreductase (luciferase family)